VRPHRGLESLARSDRLAFGKLRSLAGKPGDIAARLHGNVCGVKRGGSVGAIGVPDGEVRQFGGAVREGQFHYLGGDPG
jgi:hypothetical protein